MKTKLYIYNMVWVLAAVMLLGTLTTSCERDNEVQALTNPYAPEEQDEEDDDDDDDDDDDQPDAMARQLSAIPGVSGVTKDFNTLTGTYGYYFDVLQLVDNTDPTKGTFQQRCLLEIKDVTAPVMLYTNGNNLDNMLLKVGTHDVATYLNANTLYVEHRYFGTSLPEHSGNLDFTYHNAMQAAYDLHRVVTLLKQHLFNKGNKWVATGTGNCGINCTLYAYYSDQFGWDDIDLYMPFCAPFLTGTPQSPCDKSVGLYLTDVCGTGYPKGSPQEMAYQRLRAYPDAIANDKVVRDACLQYLHVTNSNVYLQLLKDYPGDIEKAATVGALYVFYTNLAEKFSYIDFNDWCKLVPDPADYNTADPKADLRLQEIATFVFMGRNELEQKLEEDEEEEADQAPRRSAYSDEALVRLRADDPTMPYNIQAVRELGTPFPSFSLLPAGGFVTPDYCDQVFLTSLSAPALFGRYQGQWDGGKLMKAVRSWTDTTRKHLVFVYGTNDYRTGGAIDSDTPWGKKAVNVNPRNSNVSKIRCVGGLYGHAFLEKDHYTTTAANAIKQALDKHIGSK